MKELISQFNNKRKRVTPRKWKGKSDFFFLQSWSPNPYVNSHPKKKNQKRRGGQYHDHGIIYRFVVFSYPGIWMFTANADTQWDKCVLLLLQHDTYKRREKARGFNWLLVYIYVYNIIGTITIYVYIHRASKWECLTVTGNWSILLGAGVEGLGTLWVSVLLKMTYLPTLLLLPIFPFWYLERR